MEERALTHTQKRILITASIVAAVLLAIVLLFGWVVPSVAKLRYKLAYADWIAAYSRENDLDPYFVCGVIFTESKFNPNAQSGAGARGLMQVMPATGAEIAEALGIAYDPDMLFDPETSIRFGTYYLRQQMNTFDNNPKIVLAAYNAGPHRATQWLSDYGLDSKGGIAYIPFGETDRYVDRVLLAQSIYVILYRGVFTV